MVIIPCTRLNCDARPETTTAGFPEISNRSGFPAPLPPAMLKTSLGASIKLTETSVELREETVTVPHGALVGQPPLMKQSARLYVTVLAVAGEVAVTPISPNRATTQRDIKLAKRLIETPM